MITALDLIVAWLEEHCSEHEMRTQNLTDCTVIELSVAYDNYIIKVSDDYVSILKYPELWSESFNMADPDFFVKFESVLGERFNLCRL